MNDFESALAPKSDQINAMDLIGGDMIVTVAGVVVDLSAEQKVSIRLNETPKVWRPCKTTGRILKAAWGSEPADYVGRSVQLYLDPDVKWGGMKVGGIRIRAISHIDRDLTLALAESKQNRKLFTIKPLAGGTARSTPPRASSDVGSASPQVAKAKAAAEGGKDAFRAWYNSEEGKACRATGEMTPEVLAECQVIASGADNLGPKLAADPLGHAEAEAIAEFERQRAAELAAMEGGE